MTTIAIVANGPNTHIPALNNYKEKIDYWIGADRGAIEIINYQLPLYRAVGDFDSVLKEELEQIKLATDNIDLHPSMKDETDLEIAIQVALSMNVNEIYFFGLTGGRLDHELINIQLLYQLLERDVKARIVDQNNELHLLKPGNYSVENKINFKYISFLPFTQEVKMLSLKHGFKYEIKNESIKWGSTLCISNEFNDEQAHLSFEGGLLLMVYSKDMTR